LKGRGRETKGVTEQERATGGDKREKQRGKQGRRGNLGIAKKEGDVIHTGE